MTNPNLPQIDDTYIRYVYTTLSNMEVDLDGDPLRYGPKRLQGKVAGCRRHLTKCQQIFLQLSDDLQRLNREHRRAKLDFELSLQDMLTNDPEVRAGRNVRDREAIATTRLRTEREYISGLEAWQSDLEAVIQVVKAKREDLKDVQGRIRDQIKLCQEEINLGSSWGSAPPPDTNVTVDLDNHPQVDTKAMEQFNQLLRGVESVDTEVSDLDAFVASETIADQLEAIAPEPDLTEEEELAEQEAQNNAYVLRFEPQKAAEAREEEAFRRELEATSTGESVSPEPLPAPITFDDLFDDVIDGLVKETTPTVVEDEESVIASSMATDLPTITEQGAPVDTVTEDDVESFLASVDVRPPVVVPSSVISTEIDLDDLMESFN